MRSTGMTHGGGVEYSSLESENGMVDVKPNSRIAIRLRGNPETIYDVYESPGKAAEALAKMDDDISSARTLMESIQMASGLITFPKSRFISAHVV